MKKVHVLGDSISIQYGPYLKAYLAGVMEYSRKEGEAEAYEDLDYPKGANTGTSAMVLAYLKAKAASGGIDTDVLMINCGLHDIRTPPTSRATLTPLPQYKANLREIVQLVIAMGPQLVWVQTTPCDTEIHNRNPEISFHRHEEHVLEFNAAAREIMVSADVPIIDLYTFTMNLMPDVYYDHVHFHEHVREKQAAFIAGWFYSRVQG